MPKKSKKFVSLLIIIVCLGVVYGVKTYIDSTKNLTKIYENEKPMIIQNLFCCCDNVRMADACLQLGATLASPTCTANNRKSIATLIYNSRFNTSTLLGRVEW